MGYEGNELGWFDVLKSNTFLTFEEILLKIMKISNYQG